MTDPKLPARGWALPEGSETAHYFSGPRSNCRRWVWRGPYLPEPPDGAAVCRECREVVSGWVQAGPKEVFPRGG